MGAKYTSQTQSGYNSVPPPDDGSTGSNNLITWANTKTKIGDPLLNLAQNINSALVNALDFSSRTVAVNDTVLASDHMKSIEVSGTTIETLPTASSLGTGFLTDIVNVGTGVTTVSLQTNTDLFNGIVNGSFTLNAGQGITVKTNTAATGYYVAAYYQGSAQGFSTPRQAVLSGPMTTSGFPTYLPATVTGLTISTQNISASSPLIVSAQAGIGQLGQNNSIGISTTNLTWTAIPNTSTVYLYVTVINGALTTGFTTVAPVNQYGNATPAVTNGQITVDLITGNTYLGNGTSAVVTPLIVLGTATTSGGNVTATTMNTYGTEVVPKGGLIKFTQINASTTFNPTPITSRMVVQCIGGGGNGGPGGNITVGQGSLGGGGGGAGQNLTTQTTTIATSYTATVGNAGGVTSFGSLLSANGGTTGYTGATLGAANPINAGGNGCGTNGGLGARNQVAGNANGLAGGAAQANTGSGGGGGSGCEGSGSASYTGGAGGAGGTGVIYVWEYA